MAGSEPDAPRASVARAQISALDGFIAAAGTGANRVALATASVQQVATLGSAAL